MNSALGPLLSTAGSNSTVDENRKDSPLVEWYYGFMEMCEETCLQISLSIILKSWSLLPRVRLMKLWCHLSKLRSTGKLLPPTETVAGGRWWREWIVSSSLGAAKDFHCPSCLAAIFTAPRTYLVSTQAAFAGKDQCAETADHGQERIRQSSCEVKNLLQRPVIQLKSNFSNIYIYFVFTGKIMIAFGGGVEQPDWISCN